LAFADNLRLLREQRNLSQEQLADNLNIPRSTITHYESQIGERLPRMDRLQQIADFFGVTIDQLVANTWSQPKEEVKAKGLPILGTIHAGLPILAEENYDGSLDVPESIRADYVLRVTGDSMIGAGILDGDYAICRKTEEPQTGQIIVALKDEGSISEATLKYYFNGNGNPQLKAANPAYPDINYKDGYRCAGNMVALIREDAPGYQTYRDYIAVAGHEEWTEVIELSTESGLKVNQVKEILAGQIDIAKKLRG